MDTVTMAALAEAMRGVFSMVVGIGAEQILGHQVVVSSVGAFAALVILNLTVKGSGLPPVSWVLNLGALGLVVGFALVAEAASLTYLVPLCRTPEVALAARIGAPVLSFLVLGTPLAALILRGSYGKTMGSLIFALVAMFLAIAAANTLLRSVGGEFEGVSAIRSHRDDLNSQLKRR
jgi:hypothetical protein